MAAIREAMDSRERTIKAPMRLADELRDFTEHVNWIDTGPDSDESLRMMSGFAIGKAEFHVEAIRVKLDATGCTTMDGDARESEEHEWIDDHLEDLIRVLVGDGGFQTVKIKGKDYAIFVYPASQR